MMALLVWLFNLCETKVRLGFQPKVDVVDILLLWTELQNVVENAYLPLQHHKILIQHVEPDMDHSII